MKIAKPYLVKIINKLPNLFHIHVVKSILNLFSGERWIVERGKLKNVNYSFYILHPERFFHYIRGLNARLEKILKIYHISDEILLSLGEGGLVIDCRGNIGKFTRAILEKVTDYNLKIIVFEPSEEDYKIASMNLRTN